MTQSREPLLNVPGVVSALLFAFCLVHVVRVFLSNDADLELLIEFAFIPARYDSALSPHIVFPGGLGAELWTFITYAFIHGDITHLFVNSIWLLPFGSAVARRFGTARFLAFFAVSAAVGAALHLATHTGELVPMVGASGAISGCMAAALRFVFQRGGPLGGPLGVFRATDDAPYKMPAAPLTVALRDTRILAFLGVWFGLNLLFGLGSITFPGAGVEQSVAWETHIGGFLVGLLLFSLFDPVRGQPLVAGEAHHPESDAERDSAADRDAGRDDADPHRILH